MTVMCTGNRQLKADGVLVHAEDSYQQQQQQQQQEKKRGNRGQGQLSKQQEKAAAAEGQKAYKAWKDAVKAAGGQQPSKEEKRQVFKDTQKEARQSATQKSQQGPGASLGVRAGGVKKRKGGKFSRKNAAKQAS